MKGKCWWGSDVNINSSGLYKEDKINAGFFFLIFEKRVRTLFPKYSVCKF